MSGVEIIRAIQSIANPTLDQFFYVMTALNNDDTYILGLPVLMSILMWVYDKRFARYLAHVTLLGVWSNSFLKASFDTTRPSPDDVRVIHPETGTGPAFPSGHAQNALLLWGALALQFRRTWFTVLATAIIFLVGLSRLYLGVHWPLDVLGGWAIGAIMLYGFSLTSDFWTGAGMPLGRRLAWALGIPGIVLVVSMLSGHLLVNEMSTEHASQFWMLIGAYTGFTVGGVLEDAFVGFDPKTGTWLQQVIKVVVGLVIVFGVKEGFKLFLPDSGLGDMIRYFCVAMAITFAAPWVFRRFVAAPPVGTGRSVAR